MSTPEQKREETDPMADEKKALGDLKQSIKQAHGDKAKIATAEATFGATPGTTTDGGKVFSITDGSAIFVTQDGGKVFSGKRD
jgi:hypothetical protein